MKTKKILIVGALIGVFVLGSIGVSNKFSYAEQVKRVEDYTKIAGEYIKKNPQLLSKSIDAVEQKSINNEEIVTHVELLPISIAEIEFRKGLRQIAGNKATDNKSLFNTLVEEKLIINYAIKNNVLPTRSEINNFIESQKLLYQQDNNFKKAIDAFCLEANMSLEDYWNTYEYYNSFRIVTFKKAADHAINIGINKGELKALEKASEKAKQEIIKEHGDYWKKIKKDMKDKITLKINKQYLDKDFTVDNSKSYL